ncbi:MAG: cupin domain-containing protein [Bacteroidota bacterium]|nr:cupin domain-containing protein [Bacteroidota bacterium]
MRLSKGQYFGRTEYAINVNGIILTRTEYKGSEQIPKHLHSNPYFCYVLKGSYLENFNAKQFECNKGDIIFHTADSEHSNQFYNCPSVCFNLEMEKQWLEKISYPLFSRTEYKNNDEATGLLFNKVLYEAAMYDELSPLMIESLTIEALVRLERKAEYGSVPKYIKTVKDYIND